MNKPTTQEQRAAWIDDLKDALPAEDVDSNAKLLAGQFNLNLRDIRHTAAQACTRRRKRSMADKVWDACCNLTRPRLDQLAQRIEPKATWDDLVLPAEALGLLHQIAAQVRGRYQVYEDWGYAKTMTRGLGHQRPVRRRERHRQNHGAPRCWPTNCALSLYRIDLSAVVSKYIGETEKNLRKLFDAAEQGGAILFFDEADALFGKRSEVKDSHDRYANIEINYLLQRMESFSGLAILATNMKSSLDQAFMRRLRFIVNFPFPGVAERMQIWQKALAPDVPRDELDYERLARFNLSGGNIHSIALNAAFTAAQRAESGQGGHHAGAFVGDPQRIAQAGQASQRSGFPFIADDERDRMNIQLHIERLVLEGLPMSRQQGAVVQAAVEQELGRLLNAGQLHSQIASGGALPALQGGMIQAANVASPVQLGAQIGGAVYSGIGDRK